jgi:hypothetical protein
MLMHPSSISSPTASCSRASVRRAAGRDIHRGKEGRNLEARKPGRRNRMNQEKRKAGKIISIPGFQIPFPAFLLS